MAEAVGVLAAPQVKDSQVEADHRHPLDVAGRLGAAERLAVAARHRLVVEVPRRDRRPAVEDVGLGALVAGALRVGEGGGEGGRGLFVPAAEAERPGLAPAQLGPHPRIGAVPLDLERFVDGRQQPLVVVEGGERRDADGVGRESVARGEVARQQLAGQLEGALGLARPADRARELDACLVALRIAGARHRRAQVRLGAGVIADHRVEPPELELELTSFVGLVAELEGLLDQGDGGAVRAEARQLEQRPAQRLARQLDIASRQRVPRQLEVVEGVGQPGGGAV